MTEVTTFALEVRDARTVDDRHTIEALCVPWDTPSMLTGHPGGEVFARGAFDELLANPQAWPKVRLVDSHLDTRQRRRPWPKPSSSVTSRAGSARPFSFLTPPPVARRGKTSWKVPTAG
jgi:hypothetical protein